MAKTKRKPAVEPKVSHPGGQRFYPASEPFSTQIAYLPHELNIEITPEWNVQADVLKALAHRKPREMSLKAYLSPIAEAVGVSYEALYKWVVGSTRNPRFWTVAGVAQWLDSEYGENWFDE